MGPSMNDKINDMLLAIQAGDIRTALNLLQASNLDVNVANAIGYTPLLIAAENGHCEIVELLLQKGAEVNHQDRNGYSALMFAAFLGHEKMVEVLLNAGAQVNDKNNRNLTPLLLAMEGHKAEISEGKTNCYHLNVFELLLRKGADANSQYSKKHASRTEYILEVAIEFGDNEITSLLLQYGANPTYALHEVVRRGDIKKVRLLLGWGADINDNRMRSVLASAIDNDREEIIEILLQEGVRCELGTLISTIKVGKISLLGRLVETMGLSAQERLELITFCITHNYHDIAKNLLTRLSDEELQAQGKNGESLLIRAIKDGNSSLAEQIISRVSVTHCSLKDHTGKTALMWAAIRGLITVVKQLFLILESNDTVSTDEDGKTALMFALCAGHVEVFELLNNCKDEKIEGTLEVLKDVIQKSNYDLLSFYDNSFFENIESFNKAKNEFIAAEKGRKELVRKLLEDKFPEKNWHWNDLASLCVQAGLQQEDIWAKQEEQLVRSALFGATENGDLELFTSLLRRLSPQQLHLQDGIGKSILMRLIDWVAYEEEAEKMLEQLFQHLEKHAPQVLIIQDEVGRTALHYAAWLRHYDIVRYLISRLPREQLCIQDKFGITPIQASVCYMDRNNIEDIEVRIVELFFNAGLSRDQLNSKDSYGWSPFMWALIVPEEEGVEKLKELFFNAGFTWEDVSAASQDKENFTVLGCLMESGKLEWVQALVEKTSSEVVSISAYIGEALIKATKRKDFDKIFEIVAHKDPHSDWASIRNKYGETVLMHTAMKTTKEVVARMLPYLSYTQVLTKNQNGKTALDLAATDEIKKLIEETLKEAQEK